MGGLFSKPKTPSVAPVSVPQIPAPKPIAPAPTKESADVEVAKKDVQERERLKRGRAASRVTVPGVLQQDIDVLRPRLKDKLGGRNV